MKRASATTATISVVAALLTGAGICVGARDQADRRREAGRVDDRTAASTSSGVDASNGREQSTGAGREAIRSGDRMAIRERLQKVLTQGDSLDRSQRLLELIDQTNPADFPVFFEEANQLCEGDTRMLNLLNLLLSAWAEIDPAAAWEREFQIRGEPPYDPSVVLRIWAERNPVAALDWLSSHGKSGKAMDQVLGILASDDPGAALAWAMEHDDPASGSKQPHPRVLAALGGMFPKHVAEAIRSFAGLPDEMRGSLLGMLSDRAGSVNREGREQWLKSLRSDDERDTAVARMIAGKWISVTLDERLALLGEYPGAAGKPEAGSIYKQWVQKDREAALKSLEKLPPGDAKDAATKVAIDGLVEDGSPKEALDLMNRYPQAVDEMVLHSWFGMAATNAHEWELAISQLPRVDNEAFREGAYREIMESWLFTNRDGARRWLDSHDDVPENVRKALELR